MKIYFLQEIRLCHSTIKTYSGFTFAVKMANACDAHYTFFYKQSVFRINFSVALQI